MPIYEWKRVRSTDCVLFDQCGRPDCEHSAFTEYRYTSGSIHDPVPVPEGEGWVRVYSYQVGKVKGVGDSPSRSVKSERP